MASPSVPWTSINSEAWKHEAQLSAEARKVQWKDEFDGINVILKRKGIVPGVLLHAPDFFLYDQLITSTFFQRKSVWDQCVNDYNGHLMFIEVGTWDHPTEPDWSGIPCIRVLSNRVCILGKAYHAVRRVAKEIRKLEW